MTIRIGAVWMFLNLIAAAFLGADFVVHEICGWIARRQKRNGEQDVDSIPSFTHRA